MDAGGRRPRQLHGQATFVAKAIPKSRALKRPNSLPSAGDFRETNDVTLYAGVRLWQARALGQPGNRPGFGVGNTHGAAGFPSAEAYKLGTPFPMRACSATSCVNSSTLAARSKRWRATSIIAGEPTRNRLVFTSAKFGVVIFSTPTNTPTVPERLPELVGDQRGHIRLRRRRLGFTYARRRSGIRIAGPCAEDFRPLGDAHGRPQWAAMASTPI